ncbi:hypothetical protein F5B20DRAFT_588463 [Whalleya microplaca]|nr:hypothetical protein F5B20DRAFT_588463 [Whalleya microplaca]
MGRNKPNRQPKSKRRSRREKSTTPRLIDVLPTEGFCWVSTTRKPFLSNRQGRVIAKRFRSMLYNEESIAKGITLLFKGATEQIDQCAFKSPADFWNLAGSRIIWTRGIDGQLIYEFSLGVISARYRVRDYTDDLRADGFLEKSERLLGNTEMATAVDTFTNQISVVYGLTSDIGKSFYPWWTRDDYNEGTEESTKARNQGLMGQTSAAKTNAGDAEPEVASNENGKNEDDDGDLEMMDVDEDEDYSEDEDYNEDEDSDEDDDEDDEDDGEDDGEEAFNMDALMAVHPISRR